MSKKIVSVILTVLLMLSISGATVLAKKTPDVFSVIDDLTTTDNLLTVRNLTHRSNPGKLFISGKNLTGIVTFELKKEYVESVSFMAQIYENKEYEINLYASKRDDKWADATLVECVTQFEYKEGTYNYYTYTTKSLPEGTKFIKIEIPAIPVSYTDVQLHEISYTYKNGFNIKDNDVLFAGDVELTANTNDAVTALSFYSAGEELCAATKADGVWKGTWNAAEGLYNVYAVATYADGNKKYTDSVKVSVISDYVKAATKGEEELLKGDVNWTEWNYDATNKFYFCASKEKATSSANFTDDGIYEIALRMRMMNAVTKGSLILLDKAGKEAATPFIIQMGQPYKYIANDGTEKAFDDSVICVDNYKQWHDVKLVIDTVNMTEDVYVDNTLIGTSVNVNANLDLAGIHAIKIKPENGSSSNRIVFKELTVSQFKEKYNNPEIYANGQKTSDMRNVSSEADTLKFNCAVWDDTNVVKCNDVVVNAVYNEESKVTTVTLPELTSDTSYSVTVNDKKVIDFKTAKENVEITNFGSSDITSSVAGDTVRGTATLLNDTGRFEDFNFFLALYNGMTLAKLVKLDEYTDAYDAQKNILAEITLPENFAKENYELKFIVLDNMSNLKPLK